MANILTAKVVLSKNTRWSYANVWAPKAISEGQTPKYSVSLIIPKNSPDVAKIRAAIKVAYNDGLSKLKGNSKVAPKLEALTDVLADGDLKKPDDPAYAGCYFLNAKSNTQPQIVDINLNPIIDHSEVYSGVYGRASVTFYAYNHAGNKGIACALNNLQKISDGEPLGSVSSPEADFGGFEDDENSDFLD